MCHQFFERMQRAIGIQEILADKYYYFEKTKKRCRSDVLRDDGPVHVDAAAELDPLRRVAGAVVAEHAGRILADEQVVLPVAVVIAAADDEPVIGGKLADACVAVELAVGFTACFYGRK